MKLLARLASLMPYDRSIMAPVCVTAAAIALPIVAVLVRSL